MRNSGEYNVFKPMWQSFFSISFIWRISPACVAGIAWILSPVSWHRSTGMPLMSALMVLLSLLLTLSEIQLFRQRVFLTEDGIGIQGPGRTFARWSEVNRATIRERHNLLSRTDRLLFLFDREDRIRFGFATSVLRADNETNILMLVRRATLTTITFDKGYI